MVSVMDRVSLRDRGSLRARVKVSNAVRIKIELESGLTLTFELGSFATAPLLLRSIDFMLHVTFDRNIYIKFTLIMYVQHTHG